VDKALIVSFNTYDWIYHLASEIQKRDLHYEVLVVCDDTEIPMQIEEKYGFRLCDEARYAQRKYDLLKVGKLLGIKKLQNLRYKSNCVDIERLTTSLQLMCLVNKYTKVYYQNAELLSSIIPAICNIYKIKCIKFGSNEPKLDGSLATIFDNIVGI